MLAHISQAVFLLEHSIQPCPQPCFWHAQGWMFSNGCGTQYDHGVRSLVGAEDGQQTWCLNESPVMTFLDSESEEGNHDLEFEGEHVSGRCESDDVLHDLPDAATLPVVADDTSSSYMVSHEFSHSGLLRTAIVQCRLLERSQFRRRRRHKGPCDFNFLKQLIAEPSVVSAPSKMTRLMHSRGKNEYRFWCKYTSQTKWKDLHSVTKTWSLLSHQQKYHWYLVHLASEVLLKTTRHFRFCGKGFKTSLERQALARAHSSCDTSQSDQTFKVLGLLLTYYPRLGKDDPSVEALIRDGLRGDALRQALSNRKDYETFFAEFCVFIQQLRSHYGFASCSACMELNGDSRFAAQVHCHAYVGFLTRQSRAIYAQAVEVPSSSLIFKSMKPHTVVTRCMRGRRLYDNSAQAMHYVVGPKSSGLFRFTDLEPIQDFFGSQCVLIACS